jgi:uncharacterized protein YbjT (DUF2867 family)
MTLERVSGPAPALEEAPAAPAVFVLGASGFIGRHALAALGESGCRVIIGSRRPERIDKCLPEAARASERRQVRFERLLAPGAWRGLLDGVDVVVNCVGILRQRGRETYERVHHRAPAALAAACRERGLPLIHISALGLDAAARSRFLRSKLAGEQALRASGADWYIVRPSLLDGEGGFGAKWLRRVARWPVHPLPAAASGRIAPLDVRDLGEALARLAIRLGSRQGGPVDRELELGGLEARTLAEHLDALRRLFTSRAARKLQVPGSVTRVASHVCDLLHATPLSFGHWELLSRDNCPARNALPGLLGRPPRPVGPGEATPAPGAETVNGIFSAGQGLGLSL